MSLVKNALPVLFLLVFGARLLLGEEVKSERPPVIVQLFDWNFAEIERALPELKEVGYSHIHVSPVQKSLENGKWWGKYQPIDYRMIEGPMGTREELVALAKKAKEHDIELVVDVVLNHMAAQPSITIEKGRLKSVSFPDFAKEDFHPFAPIRDWDDERQVRNRWLFGALPDLKTESPAVRAKLVAHLKDLQACGVKGFRVDSARHIAPEDLKAIFDELEVEGSLSGEIAELSLSVFEPFLESLPAMKFYDFPQLACLSRCLAGKSPLKALLSAEEKEMALPPRQAVRFVRNHDLDRGEVNRTEGIVDARYFIEPKMIQLAYCALFGIGEGTPYVFVEMPHAQKNALGSHSFDREFLQPMIAFYRKTQTAELKLLRDEPGLLVCAKGEQHFFALHRDKQRAPLECRSELKPGRYRDVLTGQECSVTEGGVLRVIALAPQAGALFEWVGE